MKSVVIVGNGGSLKDSNLGSKIDEFDEVYRINRWKTRGWKTDAGTKTTVWVNYNPLKGIKNFVVDYHDRLGYSYDEMIDMLSDVKEIWYISWKIENLLQDWRNNQLLKDLHIYDRIKRHESLRESKRIRRFHKYPSTGFHLIWLLTQMYDKIYICGFDLFKKGKYNHYFDENPLEEVLSKTIHNRNFEYDYYMKLIEEDILTFLDKDTVIERGNYIGDDKIIKECECGKTSELYKWEFPICHYCERKLWNIL